MRNKADTQQHIDHSLFSLIQLLKSITTSQKLSLDFRIESKFGDILNGKINLLDALKNYLLELKSSVHRKIIKTICSGFGQSESKIFSLLTAPSDLSINCKLDIENLADFIPFQILNEIQFENFSPLFKMVQTYIGSDILKNLQNIEVCFNAYEVFSNLKLTLKGAFD